MENFSFKQMTVSGATKELALANTPFTAPVDTQRNATAAYRNFVKKVGTVTAADMKQFMLDFIKDKKMAPGQMAYIVLKNAVKDTRKRPYTKESIVHKGAKKYGKAFQVIDEATGNILFTTKVSEAPMKDKEGNVLTDKEGNPRMKVVSATKAEAEKYAASLYTREDSPVVSNLLIKQIKVNLSGDDIVTKFKYTPSKHTDDGKYICFGLVIND